MYDKNIIIYEYMNMITFYFADFLLWFVGRDRCSTTADDKRSVMRLLSVLQGLFTSFYHFHRR